MKRLERRALEYCRRVEKALPFGGRRRREYANALRLEVLEYLKGHPWDGAEELRRVFGAPERIAASFMEEMTGSELAARLRTKRFVLGLACAVSALLLLLVGAAITWMIVRNRQDMDGRIIVTAVSAAIRGA